MAGVQHTVEYGMFMRRRVQGDRPTLIFVHGLGESGLGFEPLLGHPGLDRFDLRILDLPGYGRSAWPASPLTLEQQADHVATWLKEAAVPTPILVGHSMGGVIGTLMAERHPDILAGFVDVEGNVSLGDCIFSGRVAGMDWPEFAESGFGRLLEAVYRRGADDAALRSYFVSMRLADPRQFHLNSRELVEISEPETMGQRLAALELPLHYVAGVPGGAAERSRELLDEHGIAWTAIEPSGHWPFIDQPDRFVEVLATVAG